MTRPTLNIPEWILVIGFLSLLISLVIISKISAIRAQSILEVHKLIETVLVEVAGEVAKPGRYLVEKGSTLAELMQTVKPKKFADLAALRLCDPICEPTSLTISRLNEIVAVVRGEGIDPIEIHLPAGSRVLEIKSKISLPKDFDLTPLNSRRMVLPGEEIHLKRVSVRDLE